MTAIFNELEPHAAQWLTRLSDAGHVVTGRVDTRDIREVQPDDVRDAVQFHAFAGIGVWSYALRLAGWPDSKPVWTGSCPCQPFSVAGRGKGTADERHLWPDWFRLIRECRPPVVFGEQVASPDGLAWLDAVRADLEGEGYAVGAADLCAAGVGAPHIRQRLYFVGVNTGWQRVRFSSECDEDGNCPLHGIDFADCSCVGPTQEGFEYEERADGMWARGLANTSDERLDGRRAGKARDGRDAARLEPERLRDARGLGHADGEHAGRDAGASHRAEAGARLRGGGDEPRASGATGQRMGEPIREGLEGHAGHGNDGHQPGRNGAQPHGPTPTSGFWSNPDWVACRDGKQRPVEPCSFPLAHGAPARVGRLRAYGNAIVSEVAATFIRAVMEATS